MFTTDDLTQIAFRSIEGTESDTWQEAGALWQRRYGRLCQCSRRARRRGCWHTWHSQDCMQSLRDAIDSGQLAGLAAQFERVTDEQIDLYFGTGRWTPNADYTDATRDDGPCMLAGCALHFADYGGAYAWHNH